MPRAILAQMILALALATLVVEGFRAIDSRCQRIRQTEQAKAELAVAKHEAHLWLDSLPVIAEAKR